MTFCAKQGSIGRYKITLSRPVLITSRKISVNFNLGRGWSSSRPCLVLTSYGPEDEDRPRITCPVIHTPGAEVKFLKMCAGTGHKLMSVWDSPKRSEISRRF